MARRKSERFRILQKLADQYENMAARHLGVSSKNLQEQQQRLQELKNFRNEYTSQFYQTGAGGMSGSSLQSFQSFIHQLDTAIAQQARAVESARFDRIQKQQMFEDKHRTRRVYDKTIERFEKKEDAEQLRREQHEQDDRTTVKKPD